MFYGGQIMLGLPRQTEIVKLLPKESFYKNIGISNEVKARFVSDIKKITITNILSTKTLNVEDGSETKEIIVLLMELKVKNYDKRIIETIAKQNQHSLLFHMQYESEHQQLVWIDKLYENEWKTEVDYIIPINGFNIDEIWKGIVLHIVGLDSRNKNSLSDTLLIKDEMCRIKKQIDNLQKKVITEKQANKQFEMSARLKEYRKRLNILEEEI